MIMSRHPTKKTKSVRVETITNAVAAVSPKLIRRAMPTTRVMLQTIIASAIKGRFLLVLMTQIRIWAESADARKGADALRISLRSSPWLIRPIAINIRTSATSIHKRKN